MFLSKVEKHTTSRGEGTFQDKVYLFTETNPFSNTCLATEGTGLVMSGGSLVATWFRLTIIQITVSVVSPALWSVFFVGE